VSGVPISLTCELLEASLVAWRVAGNVECGRDGAIAIGGQKAIRIETAPPDSMFRWIVTIDGRPRAAISLLAVLRQVRRALDPDHTATGVRLAIAPLVP
jgi:hypothetical protein